MFYHIFICYSVCVYVYICIYISVSQNWMQKAWFMSELLYDLRQVIYPFLVFIFKKIW